MGTKKRSRETWVKVSKAGERTSKQHTWLTEQRAGWPQQGSSTWARGFIDSDSP